MFTKNISHVNKINNNHPPEYFSHGDRTLNILHTKLSHNCLLNCELHRYNIIDSPFCTYGKIGDAYHYFFLVSSMLEPGMNFLTMYLIYVINCQYPCFALVRHFNY